MFLLAHDSVIPNMDSYIRVLSPRMQCRNAESRFKKILLMALFGFRCFQNDSRGLFSQRSISSVIVIKVLWMLQFFPSDEQGRAISLPSIVFIQVLK